MRESSINPTETFYRQKSEIQRNTSTNLYCLHSRAAFMNTMLCYEINRQELTTKTLQTRILGFTDHPIRPSKAERTQENITVRRESLSQEYNIVQNKVLEDRHAKRLTLLNR